jgi:hypothetical protein
MESHRAGGYCEVVPGRNHFDLAAPSPSFPDGMYVRIAREMQAGYDRATADR